MKFVLFVANEKSTSEFQSRIKKKKTRWRQSDGKKTEAGGSWLWAEQKGNERKKSAAVMWWGVGGVEKAECQPRSVTDSGSTAVCCPSGRRWWEGRWCPPRCCLETRRVRICLRSASATRCGRFLQWKQQRCWGWWKGRGFPFVFDQSQKERPSATSPLEGEHKTCKRASRQLERCARSGWVINFKWYFCIKNPHGRLFLCCRLVLERL